MRSGRKSLEEGIRFLEALGNQLLNESVHPDKQMLDVFGIMCPRTAVSQDLTPEEVDDVKRRLAQHRGMQAAPIYYAKAVAENLLREYDRADQVLLSEVEEKGHWTEAGDPCFKKDCGCASRRRAEQEKRGDKA